MSRNTKRFGRGRLVAVTVMVAALCGSASAWARAHGGEERPRTPAEAMRERIVNAKIGLIGNAGEGRAALKAYSLRLLVGIPGLELRAGVAHVLTSQGKLQKKLVVGVKGLVGLGFGVAGAKEQLISQGAKKGDGLPIIEYGGGFVMSLLRGFGTISSQADWRSPGGMSPSIETYGPMIGAFLDGGVNVKIPLSRPTAVPHLTEGENLVAQAEAAVRAGSLAKAGQLVGQVEQALTTTRTFLDAPLK